jgi:hypothetical protein
MLIGIGSVKGSPGVTTLGLGLAAVWPGGASLLVEADPSGGDVAVWYGLSEDPGLVSLAAAARRATGAGLDVLDHAQRLDRGMYVVPGPAGADQTRAATALLASRPGLLRSAVGASDGVSAVVVDLGRLDPDSPASPLLNDLDVLLVVSRGGVNDLAHLAARGPVLADQRGVRQVGMLLTQGCRYRVREVEDAVGLPFFAAVPYDDVSAAAVTGSPPGPRLGRGGNRLGSRPMVTALRALAVRLETMTPRLPATSAPPAIERTAAAALLPGRKPERGPERRPIRRPAAASVAPMTAEEAGWTRPARTTSPDSQVTR